MSSITHSPLDLCRSLVLLERLLYLNKVDEKSIASENLLDRHQHQTILRLYYENNKKDFHSTLERYYSSYQERVKLLKKVISLTNNEFIENYPYYKDLISMNDNISEAREKITKKFNEIIRNYSLSKELYFANKFGFAIFPELKIEATSYGLISRIYNSRFTSVGGLMYYGFNIQKSPVYYYQMLSIAVLAATLHLYSNKPFPTIKNNEWWNIGAYKEVHALSHTLKDFDEIFRLTLKVLELHEQGHSLCVNGNKTLYDFLKSIGVRDEDFYKTDFPTDNDLKSWDRVKNGACAPRDVCFLLGDFLANISALLAGMQGPEILLMRAFNWGISSPPASNRRPRGKVSFLRYSLDKNFDDLFYKLEKIFTTARKCPAKTKQAMQDMDIDSWHILEKHYNVGIY